MDFALTNPEANHASRKEAMDRQLVLREEVEAKKEAAAVAAMQLLVHVDPEGVVRLSDRDLENTAARAAVKLLLPPPDDFGRVLYVKSLQLDGNRITQLPACIGDLADLATLNLGYNMLAALPPELCYLPSLQSLYLNNNRLERLPDSVGNLRALKYLYLDGNKLEAETLPVSLADLGNLETLWLHNNRSSEGKKLRRLPEWLSDLLQAERRAALPKLATVRLK